MVTSLDKSIQIRKLLASDAEALRAIRMHAVTEDQAAFYVTAEEEASKNLEDYLSDLDQDYYAGVFDGDQLVGVAAYNVFTHVKQRHRGLLHAVFLRAEYRGKGLARQLLLHVLEVAAQHLEILVLTVTTTSHTARKTYVSLGFESYGVEPKTQKIGHEYFDEEFMWVDLTRKYRV